MAQGSKLTNANLFFSDYLCVGRT